MADIVTLFSDPAEIARTVVVVEDEILMGNKLDAVLRARGFHTLHARNAAEAIKLIDKSGARIDVIFSDVMTPGDMSAVGLAQWILANSSGRSVPDYLPHFSVPDYLPRAIR